VHCGRSGEDEGQWSGFRDPEGDLCEDCHDKHHPWRRPSLVRRCWWWLDNVVDAAYWKWCERFGVRVTLPPQRDGQPG